MSSKKPSDSKVQTVTRMFPSDANPAGNVFGGEILKQIDIIAGIVAQRHCRTNVVTASIDKVDFLKPVFVGEALILNARLNYVGTSSMEVEVSVQSENLITGDVRMTGTAFVTMVAIDEHGKSLSVPQLILDSEDDKKRFEEAKNRMEKRKSNS